MITSLNTPVKRLLFATGLTAAAVVVVPAGASAHSYSYNNYKHADADYSKEVDTDDRDERRCERLGYRLDRLNGNFDQYNENRTMRTQTVIDKINDRECQTDGTIVDALVNNGNFTTLVTAVQAAGLAEALSAPGDKTVFAPTDQAFANLPEGTVEALVADPSTLASILTYHVVDGAVDAETVVGLEEATTLNGQNVAVDVREDGVYINDSKLVLTDIMTNNGIVHVIDAVLMPKM